MCHEKFLKLTEKWPQIKAHDSLILKMTVNLKLVKIFTGYPSLKIWEIFVFFQILKSSKE